MYVEGADFWKEHTLDYAAFPIKSSSPSLLTCLYPLRRFKDCIHTVAYGRNQRAQRSLNKA